MKWAASAIEQLKRGEPAQLRPRGHSMSGRIENGQLVTIEPIAHVELNIGDVVLARVQGKRRALVVLHQILERDGERVLIGAANGRVDGWIETSAIFGRVTQIQA